MGLDYVQVLGRACYNFAYLEACVIRCIELFEDGYQLAVRTRKMTAGQVAFDFVQLSREDFIPDKIATGMARVAGRFDVLVDTRNDLLHGRPRTSAGGEQRLYRLAPDGHEVDWTLGEIEDAANDFETCAMDVIDILERCQEAPLQNSTAPGAELRK